MRYYVVSEAELAQLLDAAYETYTDTTGVNVEILKCMQDKAEAACRARVVPEWATHFAKLYGPNWLVGYVQEIKK